MGAEIVANLFIKFSPVNCRKKRKRASRLRNHCVILRVLADGEREPILLAMTHVQWKHVQSGHESTDSKLERVELSLIFWRSDCRTHCGPSKWVKSARTPAEVKRRPRPLAANEQAENTTQSLLIGWQNEKHGSDNVRKPSEIARLQP